MDGKDGGFQPIPKANWAQVQFALIVPVLRDGIVRRVLGLDEARDCGGRQAQDGTPLELVAFAPMYQIPNWKRIKVLPLSDWPVY